MRNNKTIIAPEPIPPARVWELQADICQTLANPKRLQILHLLKDQELPVGAMVQALGLPKANLSQHLGLMRQKGILAARRQGTSMYYRIATPAILKACNLMRQVLQQALSEKGRLHADLLAGEESA
jgi:ArsR family transcriptional regulator